MRHRPYHGCTTIVVASLVGLGIILLGADAAQQGHWALTAVGLALMSTGGIILLSAGTMMGD